jgi:hypothetical protein
MLATLSRIRREKPTKVIVQLPQGTLLLFMIVVGKILKIEVIADVHTGFLFRHNFKSTLINRPFKNLLNSCDLVIIHNEEIAELLPKKARGKTMVVYDPWHLLSTTSSPDLETKPRGEYMVIPCSYRDDEPIEEILESVKELIPDRTCYVTGDWKHKPSILKYQCDTVLFTGYLPQEKYEDIMKNSTAVVTGTRDEYTSLMSAWEAVAYRKPLILSETTTLKHLFQHYAVFFDYRNKEDIAQKIRIGMKSEVNDAERDRLLSLTKASIQKLHTYLSKEN